MRVLNTGNNENPEPIFIELSVREAAVLEGIVRSFKESRLGHRELAADLGEAMREARTPGARITIDTGEYLT